MVQDSVFVYAPLSELRLCVYTSLPSAGLGFRVQGSGFRIKGFGLMALRVSGLWLPASALFRGRTCLVGRGRERRRSRGKGPRDYRGG